jgi:hypothetical protein
MLEALLPTGDTAFAVQDRHVAFDVAAVAVEYRFARQSMHGEEPVSALCFPASHALQA